MEILDEKLKISEINRESSSQKLLESEELLALKAKELLSTTSELKLTLEEVETLKKQVDIEELSAQKSSA